MSNIELRVKKIVAEQLGAAEDDIKNESSFVNDLGADSLDTVELVMALEEEFDIEIPDACLNNIAPTELACLIVDCNQAQTQNAGASPACQKSKERRELLQSFS